MNFYDIIRQIKLILEKFLKIMHKQYKSFLIKTLALTSIIVGVFNIWWIFINASENNNQKNNSTNQTNSYNFENTKKSQIWRTWVAITTNLWIRFKERWEIPASIYKDIFSINDLELDNYDANNVIIVENMAISQEYKDILRSDFKNILDESLDRPAMLNAIIEQLEYRYEIAVEQIRKLNEQKTVLNTEMNNANEQKNQITNQIETDFIEKNPQESISNINEYLQTQNNYYYARTYNIFIDQFLREYNVLNNYNARLLDTLINNKNAIINNSYVVIPNTWDELLREFELLYDEEEFKATRQ